MRTKPSVSSRRTSAQWEKIVEQSETTTLSLRAVCDDLGVPLQSLYYWRSKLKGSARLKPSGFLELKAVNPPSPPPEEESAIELRLTNGRVVRVTGGRVDAQALRTLIQVAEGCGAC